MDFMDDEAEVGSSSEDEREAGDGGGGQEEAGKKKRARAISSDEDEDEEDDEDEEKAREEMKDFIAEEEDDDEATSASKKMKRPRRSRSRSEEEEDIDDEDRELLAENLGIDIKKRRKRIRVDSGSEDEDSDEAPKERGDDLPDVDGGAVDSGDDSDFIVGDDGRPIRSERKKKTHLFADEERQLAEDIFGVKFDYGEFEGYGDDDEDAEEDYEDDESDLEDGVGGGRSRGDKAGKRRKKPTKTIFEMYEPKELELRHFTDADNEIRNTDIPERMQLRATPVTSVPEGSDELDREAEWIYERLTKPTLSKQDLLDCGGEDWHRRRDGVVEKIRKALDFMRQQFHEVPFLAFYRKEYVQPELKINDLWRVYHLDEQWCKLQARKKNLRKLYERCQTFQGETMLTDTSQDFPEDVRLVTNEDLEGVDGVKDFEELKDLEQQFKLYYSRDRDAIVKLFRKKRKEEKETKRMLKKFNKKANKVTKTVLNDEGEEIQVTDEEAEIEENAEDENVDQEEEEEEEEERVFLKYAHRNDAYSLCRKHGIAGISTRFGLRPSDFGENLHDGYQKIDVDQVPDDPLTVAAEYGEKSGKIRDPATVLENAKWLVATLIGHDPKVRSVVREAFYERATINVKPTKRGIKDIDESHDCYAVKYLRCKPVRDLSGDTFLRILQAEQLKLVEVELAKEIPSLSSGKTFLEEAQELFTHDAFSKSVTEWNNLRKECVEIAFKKFLYPMLRTELRNRLEREAKDGVLKSSRSKLYDWLKIGKYSVQFEEEDEDDWGTQGGCRIMAVMYENDKNVAAYAVSITTEGEVAGYLKLEHLLKSKKAYYEADQVAKETDMKLLREFILKKRPHCIVVGAADRKAINIKEDVEHVVQSLVDGDDQFPRLGVYLLEDNLATVYANSERANQDFREYPTVLRQAISLARRMQDPLVEFAQLTGPEHEVLCLRYHRMQDCLSEEELLEGLGIEFINRVCEVGVDINECVAHPHMSNLVQFVGGLGPRKGAALLKTLRQMQSSQRLENRQQLVTLCHMGPKVLINCAGFIKIDTSSLGDSEVYVEVLDGSRIHNEAYEWARKMAVDALEYEEEDGNPANALEEILQEPEKLAELDLEAFAQELERQGFGKKHITLYDIRSELHNMYKDLRESYKPPTPEETFNMVTKESPETLYVGKLVTAKVQGFQYKSLPKEELDKAAPLQNPDGNTWQCPFCGQDDFAELSDVWNHFDNLNCTGKCVGVYVRLNADNPDNGISGFISNKNISDKAVINPKERVQEGQMITCRIAKIQPERYSVDCICKSSALLDKDNEWKLPKDDYYDYNAEGEDTSEEAEKKKAQQRQTYTKRVIVHPNFYNIGYKDSEKLMVGMQQGDVVVRPSSKGEDHLTVTWKVADGICQHIDVKEERKINSFSLGQSLWIGTEEFEDLDEIIARHINPMAAHARDLLHFKYCRDSDGGKRDVAEELLRQEKKSHPTKIHYIISPSKDLPGKFMLSYLPRNKCRHEYVTISPDGFRFRRQNFDTVSALFKWFKENFREPIPGTPANTTQRTPYLTGTPAGGITPGAMSMAAANTPYGTTPGGGPAHGYSINTPYTPSGQTPILTPYNTPGPSSAVTPRGGSGANTPRGLNMPPPGRRTTPGYHQPSPGYNRSPYSRPPPVSSQDGGWQAAADAWARGGTSRRTPRAEGANTPRGYMGSTTPQYDERRASATNTPQHQKTPRDASGPKRTPKPFGDATPLYDE